MAMPVYDRVHPLRKPKGFEPVVQRWSTAFANNCRALCVAFHGVQGRSAEEVHASLLRLDRKGAGPAGRPDRSATMPPSWTRTASTPTSLPPTGWTRRKRPLPRRPGCRWLVEDAARLTEPTGYFQRA